LLQGSARSWDNRIDTKVADFATLNLSYSLSDRSPTLNHVHFCRGVKMPLRGGGCFTPFAFALVVGFLLILGGSMADSANSVQAGIGSLVVAAILFGLAMYATWKGWE
jgi:hypothetical protein